MKVEEKYQDVLQNIEFAIDTVYKSDRELTDYSVMSALEALIDSYIAELTRREPKSFKLSPQELTLFNSVKEMCEWRLGRGSLSRTMKNQGIDVGKITAEEMVSCLRRVQKSVKFWSREGGRRGYLNFIDGFF